MENTSGGPFPGPSSNNLPFPKLSRSATDHERVLDTLENEFKRMDKMFAKGETRVFGRNSDNIFKELDLIRKKQIALAIQHTALENSPEKEA
ncbi:hypothetical protein G9A89_001493 [Geosiphon pyriformis]|nr:hypothetical protein G9A89_001493 [Geosiphon pyriformis]